MQSACFICGGSDYRKVGIVDEFPLLECANCQLQFLSPPPSKAQLDAIYANYYEAWGIHEEAGADMVTEMKTATFNGYLDLVTRHVKSGNFLDVGCATGEMLAAAAKLGFEPYGVEISPEGVATCQTKFGMDRIHGGYLQREIFPSNFFACIMMSDVIEHLPDPEAMKALLLDLLQPGGILVISTPDTGTLSRRVMQRHWPQYKEEHLLYFNRENLSRWLSDSFNILTVDHARKCLSLGYIGQILRREKKRPLLKWFGYIIDKFPNIINKKLIRIHFGELLCIAKKI
ncbi:MAG: class I SAM-dependent methyltransferase [Magnetococcales bacterium]|nr:class I SAM-dependent methyltransferase [Magnetococcales bacterium]